MLCVQLKSQHVFKIYNRTVFGIADLGSDVCRGNDDSSLAICALSGRAHCFYGVDPHGRGFYRVRRGGIFNLDGRSNAGIDLYDIISGTAADRGKLDLPTRGRQFGRTSLYLGAVCSYRGWKIDGNCWNADFYSLDVGALYLVP